MRKILHIIRKEFLQVRRDRGMLAILFIAPMLQLLLLGYVVSADVRNIQTVICDQDNSPASRLLIDRIRNSGYFALRYFETSESRLQVHLDSGRASVALVIPSGFNEKLQTGDRSQIQVLVDGQDSNTSTIAMGYIAGIIESFVTERVEAQLQGSDAAAGVHLLSPSIRVWYNQDLKNSDYMVPGIMVFLLTMVTTLVSAMGLVREREIGTLDQLLVAPVKKHELLIGKLIPFAILGLMELTVALIFARLWYHIPIVGNLGLFFIFAVIYLFTTLGIGLLVSASSSTQQQSMFMTLFLLMFFMIMSGFLFPIENMPVALQRLSLLNPMSYFILVVREIFIKGASVRHLYKQGVVLLLFGATIFSIATWRFQSRMK